MHMMVVVTCLKESGVSVYSCNRLIYCVALCGAVDAFCWTCVLYFSVIIFTSDAQSVAPSSYLSSRSFSFWKPDQSHCDKNEAKCN